MDAAPKWVVWSVTMLGAAVVAVTNVLPSVNGLLGLVWPGHSIEPSWITDFGTYATKTIEGVGGLIGLVMVIYGRLVAKQPLTLLPPAGTAKAIAFIAFIPIAAMLASCNGDQGKAISQWAADNCGVLISPASAGAVVATGQPLAGAAVEIAGKAICEAWKTHVSTSALASRGACPTVGGVEVCAEKVDRAKLDAYKP